METALILSRPTPEAVPTARREATEFHVVPEAPRAQIIAEPDAPTSGNTWMAVRRVHAVIRELREINTLRELVDATPAALCRLGFDRAMISRVEDLTWVVERFYAVKEPAWAEQINAVAQESPAVLEHTLVEADMMRRRRAALIMDAQHDVRVSKALAEVTRWSSYVAAPIMPDGQVIGFLHADRYYQGQPVNQFDLEVLSQFTEQYGQVFERTLLLERLDGLRVNVATLTEVLNGTVRDCHSAPIDMRPEGERSPSAISLPLKATSESVRGTAQVTPDSVLTRRELDVLRLMATGDTNARIASRLVISESTVKSHVAHILRKLNSSNRAEAVCRWLQSQEQAS